MGSFLKNAGTGWLLMVAANDEALRAGHSQVDTDHLLLGMLVGSGEGGAALRSLGVDLDRARLACAELARQDVADLGIDDEGWTSPAPERYAAQMLPSTDRASLILKNYQPRQGEMSLLRDLAADPHGPAGRLLAALGLDPADLPIMPIQPESSDAGWTATADLEVALPAERIWALISDPLRRPEWDEEYTGIEIVDPETFTAMPSLREDKPRISRIFGLNDLSSTFHVIEAVPGAAIHWRIEVRGRSGLMRRRPGAEEERIELLPAADRTTRLVLRMRRSRGGDHAAARWAFEARLRMLAQAIAQVA